jgi:hypothetical protein
MVYAEPTTAPEVLYTRTEPASMASLGCGWEDPAAPRPGAHRPARDELIPAQHYCALARTFLSILEGPTRLHREDPITDDVIKISNFLVMGNQRALMITQGVTAQHVMNSYLRNTIVPLHGLSYPFWKAQPGYTGKTPTRTMSSRSPTFWLWGTRGH